MATAPPCLSHLSEYKTAAKRIIKTLTPSSPSKCSITAGPYLYHYSIDQGVVYLTLADRSYPKRLAFQYLDAVQHAFNRSHTALVSTYSRPYAAVSFDPTMSRIRREYLDPQSGVNVRKLQGELSEIHNIMTSNIESVLARGEKLDVMEGRSAALLSESKKFEKMGRYINLQALYKTYGPIAAVVLVVLFILYLRFFR